MLIHHPVELHKCFGINKRILSLPPESISSQSCHSQANQKQSCSEWGCMIQKSRYQYGLPTFELSSLIEVPTNIHNYPQNHWRYTYHLLWKMLMKCSTLSWHGLCKFSELFLLRSSKASAKQGKKKAYKGHWAR